MRQEFTYADADHFRTDAKSVISTDADSIPMETIMSRDIHMREMSLNDPSSLVGKTLNEVHRIIEEKKISRIGSNQEIDLNIRFVFATNIDLEQAVQKNQFRKF